MQIQFHCRLQPLTFTTGSHDSLKSETFYSSDWSSGWPSPMARCSNPGSSFGSFSSESSEVSLPRLPELDHISLEILASHYANSAAEKNQISRRPSVPRMSLAPLASRGHLPSSPLLPPVVCSPAPSSASFSVSSPSCHSAIFKTKRKPAARGSRCNVKYTIEQKDFIDYWRIDRHERETAWEEVVREYNAQFKGPHRAEGGLQSAWYRENKKIPIADAEGLLIFNDNDEIRTSEVPVREAKGKFHSVKSIGLLATHPERAIEYPWVSREHKRQVWRVGTFLPTLLPSFSFPVLLCFSLSLNYKRADRVPINPGHARRAQLDAAARRQRKRAELEARLAKSQEGAAIEQAARPEIEPFEAPLMRRHTEMWSRL